MAKRVIWIWVLVQAVFFGGLLLFRHAPVDITSIIYNSLSLLLFILSVSLSIHESQIRTRLLFLNFSLFFGLSLYYCLFPFIGHALFAHSAFARFFSIQYILSGLFALLLAQTLGFTCLDAVLNGSRPYRTYVVSFCAVTVLGCISFCRTLHILAISSIRLMREILQSFLVNLIENLRCTFNSWRKGYHWEASKTSKGSES